LGNRDFLCRVPSRLRIFPVKKTAKEIAVLVSGGMDSCILLADLSQSYDKVHPLYIKKGLLWEGVELYWLRRFLTALRSRTARSLRSVSKRASTRGPYPVQKIRILKLPIQDLYSGHWSITGQDVPDYETGDPSVYLPGRNLLLLAKAVLFCEMNQINRLALGPLKGNPFPDSSKSFFQSFQKTASLALNSRITIITPFLHLSKTEVIQKGRRLPLELTFSCIQPVDKNHCGMCNKCAERQRAFEKAGIVDKTVYRGRWPGRR
jgi:7-cyano-7-deazaguanine synthase